MGEIVDMGRRVELVPMDPHFHDISIGLYCQRRPAGPAFLVHTYSRRPGAAQRVGFIAGAMRELGGMVEEGAGLVRFPCWAGHERACRRVFLEACKLDPSRAVEVRPLGIFDKKSNRQIAVRSLGEGKYRISAEGEDASRAAAVAGGLVKLGQMTSAAPDQVEFSCGWAHDALVGLLLIRALNVRAVLREQEMAASRGILAAPSAQRP